MTQEFHISVTPVRGNEYLVRVEQVEPGVPLAEEQLVWPVVDWLAQARQLMNDPLLGVLQGDRVQRVAAHRHGDRNPSEADLRQSALSLVELGRDLYSSLFQGTLRDSWMTAQGIAQHRGEVLRLRLGLKGSQLPKIPWEVLQGDNWSSSGPASRPIATGTDIIFSRYQPGALRTGTGFSVPDSNQPIRVLMAIAAPTDQQQLELKREASHLQQELRHPGKAMTRGMIGILPDIQLTILEQPGREELAQALEQGQYHVLHYAGHSDLNAGGGILYLVNRETGLTETLSGDDLAGLLVNNGIRMVVFNSCRGSYTATSDPLASADDRTLTEALVRRGIPAVLAMAEQIPDPVALTLTRLFYRNLKQGYPVDLSLSRARQGLLSAYGASQLYWALPVLYLHPEFDGYLTSSDRKLDNPADSLVRIPQFGSALMTRPPESVVQSDPWNLSEADAAAEFPEDLYMEAENFDDLVHNLTYGDESVEDAEEVEDWQPEADVAATSDDGFFSDAAEDQAFDSESRSDDDLGYFEDEPDDPDATVPYLVRELIDPMPPSPSRSSRPVDEDLTLDLSSSDVEHGDRRNGFSPPPPPSEFNGTTSWPSAHSVSTSSSSSSDTPLEPLDAPELELPEATSFQPSSDLWEESGRDPAPPPRVVRQSLDRRLIVWPLAGLGLLLTLLAGYWAFSNRFILLPKSPEPEPPVEELQTQESNAIAQDAIINFQQNNLESGAQAVEALLDQGALIQAKAALNAVPVDAIDNPRISFLRGRLGWQLRQQGDLDFSIDDTRRYWEVASRGDPDSLLYANALGFALYEEAKPTEAIDALRRVLSRLDPQGITPSLTQVEQALQAGAGEPIQLPSEPAVLTSYAGMALALAASADDPAATPSADERLQQAVRLHQAILATDPVTFDVQNLTRNWLWTPAMLEDWQQLSSLTLEPTGSEPLVEPPPAE